MTKLSQRRRIAQARVDGLLGDAGSILLALSAYPLEERAFMRSVVAGLVDLGAGRELSLADAKARLGLK